MIPELYGLVQTDLRKTHPFEPADERRVYTMVFSSCAWSGEMSL